ncbi:MAG: deoxyguanosinetriphosphate triphosphohydrolase [Candidatus Omnitrophica bacterium]|nr:deoxyguanosinetriphosphate triphosphohydrolase [Candidatus Omnitrophota bacterium]
MNREEYQKLEDNILAAYALKSSETRGRVHKEKEDLYRTCFQRDRDRIIHSTAFRRLEYKTQVFVIHEGDYYRTRLTHSLEVAQIARSIARALSLNSDLVEAIALGHDVGHTPFGHSVEELLKNELMKDCGGFDHNLQGLRVVDYLESRYPDFRGLNLTWEVREGLVKHITLYDEGYKRLESKDGRRYGNIDLSEFYTNLQPTLEAQVVNIADEIAYDNHDLDDGLTSGLIDETELQAIPLWLEAKKKVKEKYSNLSFEFEKHQVIRTLIDMDVKDVISSSLDNLSRVSSHKDARSSSVRLIDFSPGMQDERKPLRHFLLENLYRHYRVERMSNKAKMIIEGLFNAYMKNTKQLPPQVQDSIKTEGDKRAVCDYVASMTDHFAQNEYKKLFDPLERV